MVQFCGGIFSLQPSFLSSSLQHAQQHQSLSQPTQTPTPTRLAPTPTSQPTPHPQSLIICATEPQAVSPFWSTQAGDDILALFYEPPMERVAYDWEPRLVERVPSLQNGDVITRVVPVTQGMRYADLWAQCKLMKGTEPTELPQLSVRFTLKAGYCLVRWCGNYSERCRSGIPSGTICRCARILAGISKTYRTLFCPG